MALSIGSQEWKDEFVNRREAVVDSLRSIVATCSDIVCQPCTVANTFGWQFEQGHTGNPPLHIGNLDYASNYIRHMINQGFRLSVGIAKNNGNAIVCLKAWEDEEPNWPLNFTPQTIISYRPIAIEEDM